MSKITRSKRNTPFVLINKESLQDKSISWQAKGLLAYLLSLPDNWQILVSDLSNRSKNGRDSTAAILNELIEAGYIERVRCKNEKNQFDGYSYTVFDSPQTEKPNTEKPFTGNPFTGFPNTGKPTLINNNSNKETLNKNIESTHAQNFEVPIHKIEETQKTWNKLAPYEIAIQDYHFKSWTENLKDAFYSFCKDKYEKNNKFSGTQAKEIIRQIEIDLAIHGAEKIEKCLRLCLRNGWAYKIMYQINDEKREKDKEPIQESTDLEAYLLAYYREKDIEHFKKDGKFDKWQAQLKENLFRLTNVAKGYKNDLITPLLLFEMLYLPLSVNLSGSNADRKLEHFQRIYDKQTGYNKEKGNFREIIKQEYEKQKA